MSKSDVRVSWGNEASFTGTTRLFIKHLCLSSQDSHVNSIIQYHGHHLFNIQCIGLVIAEQSKNLQKIILLDDGTGLLECQISESIFLQFFDDHIEGNQLSGKMVSVIGFVSYSPFSRLFQTIENEGEMTKASLVVSSIHEVIDANEEYLHWMEVIRQEKELFSS